MPTETNKPTLFGLKNTNRDFSKEDDWGKNVFNTAFPTSLSCYMHHLGIPPVYLALNKSLELEHSKISVKEVFRCDPDASDIFYSFESLYVPYERLVVNSLPRIDIVIRTISSDGLTGDCQRGLEIKLTALPDNSTAGFDQAEYGPELVVRPDTIVYLALSIATNYIGSRKKLGELIHPATKRIRGWNNPSEISKKFKYIIEAINNVLSDSQSKQEPFMLQSIWKTKGKTLELEKQCLDTFVWSDYGFTKLFTSNVRNRHSNGRINRQMRTCVWLVKMLNDFVTEGKIDHTRTIRNINFGSQTDKAFASSGRVTKNLLKCDELLSPRLKKFELKNIILNGGERMLSPERRFDAAILSNLSLFE